ncbi:unnamed protein product [Paramecium sonneborni]|uniref:Uncharacterized protein n=1 Tax=Paramecium sonneborni TaxID=65129 RepID=A0A8S1Q0I2_9CILI|nr:unnamed protein product [Paramecium sonneborni]
MTKNINLLVVDCIIKRELKLGNGQSRIMAFMNVNK